jgi:membrane protease YdiL (CAAX protease family)
MKGGSLILAFFVSILLVILFVLIGYPNLTPSPNTEGPRSAYFTQVKYPAIAYEGKVSAWNLTIYNKNCTSNDEGKAFFFFKFYIDGDPWWNEYNDTDYKTWQCNKESSTTRLYGISTWETMKPVAHNLKIELYWYDGNASRFQDAVSFPISVVIYVEPGNLMVTSYFTIYLMAILFLGFYMLISGRIEVSSASQNTTFALNPQLNRMISVLSKVYRHPLCFYLFVFASWQAINALFFSFSLLEQLRWSVYLVVQIAYVILLVLVIRKESSNFKEYGYLWPEEIHKYMFGCFLLAVLYGLVTVLLPGSFAGYDVFPSLSLTEFFLVILLALVASFTSETIFRGYIQSKLAKQNGFLHALLSTSIMFALYELPLLPFNLFSFFFEVFSLFLMGIFLGILFRRTKTLLCPITFYSTVLILKSVTPIKPVTSEYVQIFFEFVAIALSLFLLSVLIVKREQLTLDDEMYLLET